MKILLVVPPTENKIRYFKGWQFEATDYGTFPPLGLLYIATFLKINLPDIKVRILDCPSQKLDYAKLAEIMRFFQADVIGITAFTVCLVDVLKIAGLAKSMNKDTHVCVGGPHLNLYHRQTLSFPEVDSIVVGEGEYAFYGLIERLTGHNGNISINGLYEKSDLKRAEFRRAEIDDLDGLPFFDITLIDENIFQNMVGRRRSVITLLSSRGCPYSCTFCDTASKIYRGRSVENIIQEIKLRLGQGFKKIFFFDDTFNITEERVLKLSKEIISQNLKFKWSFRARANSVSFEMLKLAKRAGCEVVRFGIETGTDEGLRELKKGITVEQISNVIAWCRSLKIQTISEFIIGLPFERSKKDVIDNINRLTRFDPDYAVFNVLQPVPGSQIYYEGVKDGLIDSSRWDNFAMAPSPDFQPPLWTQYLSRSELSDLFYLAHKKFYMRPKRIFRNLSTLGSLSELGRALRAGSNILLKR